jgi:hypothetical protein
MIAIFQTDIIIRIRAVITDSAHGGTKLDWSNAERTSIKNVRVTPMTSSEQNGRALVTHRLNGPLLIDLNITDRIEWIDARGRTRIFELEGEPLLWTGLTHAISHSVTELKTTDL